MVKAVENYQPYPKQAEILKCAMAHIQSVPYKVTLRWVFYRLLQDGLYHDKINYKHSFIPLQAKARKSFYENWRPDTLADDTREVIENDRGYDSIDDWLDLLQYDTYKEVVWHSQFYYVEVWFEAAAMVAQFEHYVHDIPLFAFRGDCSIAAKWDAAERLDFKRRKYGLPVVIIYFGDDDQKGREIPENAVADVKQWCHVPFEFVRGGLNPGDGKRLGIPESVDKPGAYQWEALDDWQAKEIITTTISRYFNDEALQEMRWRIRC